LVEKHADIHRFAKALIALRMDRDLPIERLDMTLNELLRRQPFQWHGVKLNAPDQCPKHAALDLSRSAAIRSPPARQRMM